MTPDDTEILSKPSSSLDKVNKVKISDKFYDMLEDEWGFEVPVVIEYESESYYFIKVSSTRYTYHKLSHTWDIIK